MRIKFSPILLPVLLLVLSAIPFFHAHAALAAPMAKTASPNAPSAPTAEPATSQATLSGASLPAPPLSRAGKDTPQDLPQMLEQRVIRVLTSYSPTIFFMDQGNIYGFEYSLMKEYEKFLNQKLSRNDEVHMEFLPMPADQLLPALLDGRGDVVAALTTITPVRAEEAAFTAPYLPSVDEVLVTNKKVKDIHSLEDLSGRSITVRPSSSYNESLQRLNRKLLSKGMKPVRITPAPDNMATENLLEMVNAGILPMTVADNYLADIWDKILPDITVHKDLKLSDRQQIAWMVRKDSPKLLASLNAFLPSVKKGSMLGNIFFRRYYQQTGLIEHPLDEPHEVEHFTAYTPLFQKYGKMYGIDWRLLAAQAYQESGFDHEATSHVGAVGIMQIMPSLKDDPRLGITDIQSVEGNIESGTKYLAYIRDNYFAQDPNVTKAEALRFALAAYNAGPSRIRRSQDVARDMGLSGQIWFHNTEYGAQKLAGLEPVRYVSRINMYYQALLHADELLQARREAMPELKSKVK